MSKTLESLRNKKFVDDTLKRAMGAKAPLPFFCILKHQDDKKPVLLLGNPDAELKKVALLPSAQIIKGKCKKTADGVEFFTDDADDAEKFKEALKKVAKDAGLAPPFVAILKPAKALAEDDEPQNKTLEELTSEGGDDDGDVPNLTFSKDSWLKFSETPYKRSAELTAIDNAFDTLATANDLQDQIDATLGLATNIETWLTKKQGNSRRLAMVSTLKEQVIAKLNALRLKDLTVRANDFKVKFAQLGQDPEKEKAALIKISQDMQAIKTSPHIDGKASQLAGVLQGAAGKKVSELNDLKKMKSLAGERQSFIDQGPILSKATKQMIASLEAGSKPLASKAVVDALFDDFCAYGRKHWQYNTTSSENTNLLTGGATKGACGTFAAQFANLVNMITGKMIAKTAEVSAKNFITVPLKSISYIDSACPGNLRMSADAQPDRYFFTTHVITITSVGNYCPTTGTKDGAIDKVVAKQGFKGGKVDGKEIYQLGQETITIEVGKGYANGALYTLQYT